MRSGKDSFVSRLMERLEFTPEEQRFFRALEGRLSDEAAAAALVDAFMGENPDVNAIQADARALAEADGMGYESFYFYLLMRALEILRERYRQRDIDEAYFWDAALDLRCKLRECEEVGGGFATKHVNWHTAFYRMQRFALGRLQYEKGSFAYETYEKNGVVIAKGSPVLNIHIPSSGPLTEDARRDSYRKAYYFFKDRLPELFRSGVLPCVCKTWLLFPEHASMLPAQSNILGFLSDFDLIESGYFDGFPDAFRIFGRYANEPPERLPRDTALRRAYAERLCEGRPPGFGAGILLFDGAAIVNK